METSTSIKNTQNKPFYEMAAKLLVSLQQRDVAQLESLCDLNGIRFYRAPQELSTTAEAAGWLPESSSTDQPVVECVPDIKDYVGMLIGDGGYSVIDFEQVVKQNGKVARYRMESSMIWKKVDGVWKASRFRTSVREMSVGQ